MTLEVLRFETLPATGAVAVLELEGTFDGPAPGRPRLLVEGKGPAREVPAVDAAGGEPWSASFAVPLATAADPATTFSLVTGRGPLIALPPPTTAGPGGDEDRYVALARSANELRHRAAVAADAADEAARRAQEAEAERDRLVHALEEERDRLTIELEAARETATGARDRVAALEQQHRRERSELEDGTRREHESLLAEAEGARREAEEARTDAEQARADAEERRARLVAAEDEVRQARRELRDTRARLEQLRRERGTPHAPADAPPPAPAQPPERTDEPPPRAHGHDPEPTERLAAITPSDESDDPPARPRRSHRAIGAHDDPGETTPMPPAQVGARLLQPSSGRPPATAITPARIAAGAALLVLVAALVAVLLGAGPMT